MSGDQSHGETKSMNHLTKITIENANQLQVIGTLEGHTAPILSIDIAPGGQLLASGSMDGTVRIWNLQTVQPVNVLAISTKQEIIPCVAFSPANPDHLAVAVGRKPFWETPDIGDYVGNLMKDLVLSPFKGKPAWRLWSLERKAVIHTEEAESVFWETSGLAYSRDGQWLAAKDGVFDITTEPYSHAARLTENQVSEMAFSDDSQLLVLATFYEKHPENYIVHFVEVFQVGSWRKVAEIKESQYISDFGKGCFLPNSHELLGGAHNLYLLKGERFEEGIQIQSDVACFACHPDGSMVAIARYDGRLILLDWVCQKPTATMQAYKPAKKAKTPRGILFGKDAANKVFDAVRSEYRASGDMAFSQDGKLLVSADGDQIIRIWGVPA